MGVTINQSIKPHPREQISLVMNARRVFVYLRVLFHLVSATLFGVFVIAKLEEGINWSWAAVFTPLFMMDVVCCVYYPIYLGGLLNKKYLIRICNGDLCFQNQNAGLVPAVLYPVGVASKLLAEILLILHLEVAVSFIPCGVFLMIFFATLTISMLIDTIKPNFQYLINR